MSTFRVKRTCAAQTSMSAKGELLSIRIFAHVNATPAPAFRGVHTSDLIAVVVIVRVVVGVATIEAKKWSRDEFVPVVSMPVLSGVRSAPCVAALVPSHRARVAANLARWRAERRAWRASALESAATERRTWTAAGLAATAANSSSATSASASAAAATTSASSASASASASSASASTASASAGSLPCASCARSAACGCEAEDPGEALLGGQGAQGALEALAARPCDQPEPAARLAPAARLPGQAGGRPALEEK
jgi:hypothetical protein